MYVFVTRLVRALLRSQIPVTPGLTPPHACRRPVLTVDDGIPPMPCAAAGWARATECPVGLLSELTLSRPPAAVGGPDSHDDRRPQVQRVIGSAIATANRHAMAYAAEPGIRARAPTPSSSRTAPNDDLPRRNRFVFSTLLSRCRLIWFLLLQFLLEFCKLLHRNLLILAQYLAHTLDFLNLILH